MNAIDSLGVLFRARVGIHDRAGLSPAGGARSGRALKKLDDGTWVDRCRNKVTRFGFHNFRHTLATLLIVPLGIVNHATEPRVG